MKVETHSSYVNATLYTTYTRPVIARPTGLAFHNAVPKKDIVEPYSRQISTPAKSKRRKGRERT